MVTMKALTAAATTTRTTAATITAAAVAADDVMVMIQGCKICSFIEDPSNSSSHMTAH